MNKAIERFLIVIVASLWICPLRADMLLSSPGADELSGPAFVQPFSFVSVDSVSAGVGETSSFVSSLPPGSFPNLEVVDIIGNFLAFDSMGNQVTDFDIVGVSVTQGANTFTPSFGLFNFDGNPSVTYTDALNPFNTTTFFSTDFTFAFAFMSDPTLTYSYTLFTTGLDAGSTLIYDDAELTTPEPSSFGLLASIVLAGLYYSGKRRLKR